jgi:hypothetical protein
MSGSISAGGTVSGSIIANGQTNDYSFVATAGSTYEFDAVSNPTTGVDPEIEIFNPQGGLQATFENGSGNNGSSNGLAQASIIAPTSGTYTVDVTAELYGYHFVAGSYTLSESPVDDFGDTPQTAGTLATGGTLNGNFESLGDVDWVNVSLTAGDSYEFDVTSNPTTGVSPQLELLTPTGATAVGNQSSSNGLAVLTYTASATGTYDIALSENTYGYHYVTGGYKLVSTKQDDYGDTAATAGNLAIGGTLAGSIEAINDIDWFGVTLTTGHSYQFILTSVATGGFSPTLELLTPSGAVAVNPAGSSNGGVAFTYTPTVSGAYDLAVAGNSGKTGSYQITALSSGVSSVDAGSGSTASTIPSGSNYVSTEGANTIFASGGATTVNSAIGSPVIFGNSSSLNFVGGSGSATVIGGSSKNTVTGGSGKLLLFAVSTTTFTGGAGAATVIGGQGALTATLGSGGGEMFGGTGAANTLSVATGSTGNAALVGTGSGDVLTDAGKGEDFLVAGAGAETLNASKSTGVLDAFFGGSGADYMIGGAGQSYFVAGSGNETLTGGSGLSEFVFIPGSTSRVDTITNFNSGDIIALFGYGGSGAGVNAVHNASVANGSTTLTLSDNTQIILQGFTSLSQGNVLSG